MDEIELNLRVNEAKKMIEVFFNGKWRKVLIYKGNNPGSRTLKKAKELIMVNTGWWKDEKMKNKKINFHLLEVETGEYKLSRARIEAKKFISSIPYGFSYPVPEKVFDGMDDEMLAEFIRYLKTKCDYCGNGNWSLK